MTRIKFCGLTRPCDIEAANNFGVDYIGFVFAPQSRRYLSPEQAAQLKIKLAEGIQTVGVFVNETPQKIAQMLNSGLIDLAQLHGSEGREEIRRLRQLSGKPIIQAFRIHTPEDIRAAEESEADYVLLDSGSGSGAVFDWELLQTMKRPYFLAGGLNACNVRQAVEGFHPYAVDVSSGIETGGIKDREKMSAFIDAVRKGERI